MDNSASQLITPPYKINRVQRPLYIKILLFKNHCCKNEALNLGRGKDLILFSFSHIAIQKEAFQAQKGTYCPQSR